MNYTTPHDAEDRMPLEIVGPARAYFEIPQNEQGVSDDVPNIRIHYRTLASWYPTKELAEDWQANIIDRIRKELWRVSSDTPIIWWRVQPTLEIDSNPRSTFRGNWYWRCRLETSPKLSDEFWRTIHAYVMEGHDVMLVAVAP